MTMAQRPLDLNVLPERYRPRRISTVVILTIVLAVVVLVGLGLAYNTLSSARARTAELRQQLDQMKADLGEGNPTEAEKQASKQALETLEGEIEQALAQIGRFQTDLRALEQQEASRSAGVAAAVYALIPRVRLTGVSQQGNTFILTGEAGSQGLVLDYSRAVQASGQFGNVRILSMVNADPLGLAPDVRFSIAAEQ